MSVVQRETVQTIGQSVGIPALSDEVATALASDVEYRVRELCQEAIKCMRHSKRSTLTTDDVNSALSLRNVEPLYGFSSSDPLRFRRALPHSDLFYVDDKDIDFQEVIEAPLPKCPADIQVKAHWLAIEGVQPAIPENPPPDAALKLSVEPKKKIEGQGGLPAAEEAQVEVKPAVKHVLSKELQLYFEKIMELVLHGGQSSLLRSALRSLATDAGLHSLVPYFTQFIADEVTRSLEDLGLVFSLMRVVHSLLVNPHIHVELYLQQIIPCVLSVLVGKKLGGKPSKTAEPGTSHWNLRDFAAELVAHICRRYGGAYQNIQPRTTKTLLHAFLDPRKTLPQHYGALKGLSALGNRVVRLLVVPNLGPYLELLRPEMSFETQKSDKKRYEATRVYGLLLQAAGSCVYQHLKQKPVLTRQLAHAKFPKGSKVNGQRSQKGDLTMQTQGDGKRPNTKEPSIGEKRKEIESQLGAEPKEAALDQPVQKRSKVEEKSHDVLAESWKEDKAFEDCLDSLFDMFGEALLPFVPTVTAGVIT